MEERRNPTAWGTFTRLFGGKHVVAVLLGALVGALLTPESALPGARPSPAYAPLAAGFVAGLLYDPDGHFVLGGALATLIGCVPLAIAAPGNPLLGQYGSVNVGSPVLAAALSATYATLVGAIGAYAAGVFHTEEGRLAWFRHVMRWRWWP